MASISPSWLHEGAALHFNRALVYSAGHTRGENHTATQSFLPLEIKTASLTETQDLADKLEVMV